MALSTRVIGKFGGAPEIKTGSLSGQSTTLNLTNGQWLLAVKIIPYPSAIVTQGIKINDITTASVKLYNASDSYFYGVATVNGGTVKVSVTSSNTNFGTLDSYIAVKTS